MLLTNLAFITSPLQLINLREFCASQGVAKSSVTVVLKFSKKASSSRALGKEVDRDRSEWGSIVTFHHRNKFLHLVGLIRRLRGHQWRLVIGGELTAWWQNVVLSNLDYETRVLLDDGTMTLFDYQQYMASGSSYQKKKGIKNLVLKALGARTKLEHPWPLQVFSVFPLSSNQYVEIVPNKLENLKKDIESLVSQHPLGQNVGAFIGQPFVDDGQADIDEYGEIVRSYIEAERLSECLYFPHRSENYRETIGKLGLNVRFSDYAEPVEYVVGKNLASFKSVCGITSTALFNLHALFPDLPIWFYPVSRIEHMPDGMKGRLKVIEAFLRRQNNTYDLSERRIRSDRKTVHNVG
ncbi:MAG: polysialyltransferase family glycosyltransferase [Marinobacter sp.]|nr:polysialyltransferase family glycosyltransferase [Marinobacter sp.]